MKKGDTVYLQTLFFIILLLCLSFSTVGAEVSLYQYNHLFLENNVFSVPALYEHIFAPLTLDEDLFFHKKIELGFRLEGERYYLGYAFIEEETLEIKASTLQFVDEFLYSREYSQDLFPILLKEMTQSLNAFFVGGEVLSSDTYSMGLTIGMKYLQGEDFTSNRYEGFVICESQSHYLMMDRISSYSRVPKVSQIIDDRMKARGYSLDASLYWYPLEDLKIQLLGENVYSSILWNDVFTIREEYKSKNLTISDKGFFFYIPIFKPGTLWEYDTYYTSLTPEFQLSLAYRDSIELGVFHHQLTYPYFSLRLLPEPVYLRVGLFGDLFSLALGHRGFRVELMTDSFSLTESTSIIGHLGWRHSF